MTDEKIYNAETFIKRKLLGLYNVITSKVHNRKIRLILSSLVALFKTKNQIKHTEYTDITLNFKKSGSLILGRIDQKLCKKVIDSARTSNIVSQDFESFSTIASVNALPNGVNSALVFPDLQNNDVKLLISEMVKKSIPIAASYLKADVIIDDVKILYSRPGESVGPQFFHRDWDTLGFVKVFCYLNDVNKKNGPHQYILGSPQDSNFNKHGRFSEDEIINFYGRDRIFEIDGSSGTFFIEDTNGIHRGLPLVVGERWMISIRLSLLGSTFRERNNTRRNILSDISKVSI